MVQTPPSPMPAPAVQTPASPSPGPAVQTPAAPPAPSAEAIAEASKKAVASKKAAATRAPVLTLDGVKAIREGMTVNEVREKIGAPGALIAGTDKASTVYRWNESGVSFLARFEDGKLIRKSIISADGGEVPVGGDEKKTIDKDLYDGIRTGMSFEEVVNSIGIDAQPISKSGASVNIYTWRDASGSSFTARFESGKLVRKTGLFVAKTADKGKEGESAEGESEEAPAKEKSAAGTDKKTGEKAGTVADDEPAKDDTKTGNDAGTTPPGPRKGRVTVAGTARREREAENGDSKSDRSYNPRAQLPRNLHRLRDGSYEIRLRNTAESRVKAAVVSKEGSAEVTIAPGGAQSVFVNQGDYVVNFIYDDDPYTLHKGGVIAIGQWLTDMEVVLFAGSYDVQVLDRSTDRPVSRSKPPSMTNEFHR